MVVRTYSKPCDPFIEKECEFLGREKFIFYRREFELVDIEDESTRQVKSTECVHHRGVIRKEGIFYLNKSLYDCNDNED